MITERDDEQQNERTPLVLSLIASAGINALVWMLLIWVWGIAVAPVKIQEREKLLVSSTSIRLERRDIPQPAHPVVQPQRAQQPQPVRPQQPRQQRIEKPEPHAPPQPRAEKSTHSPASLAQQLAQQEQMFAREARQLNASRAPLSIATVAPEPPSSFHRSYMDLSGRDRESVEALLDPLKHWVADGMSCYYVHYYAQYSGGGTEEGNIPWPVCYPAAHDAMLPLDRPHSLPIPKPPPGYVLPAGTTLQPLLQQIYRSQG